MGSNHSSQARIIGIFLTTFAVLVAAVPLWATAVPLGTFGRTYAIREKDAVQEMQERASKIDLEKEFKKRVNENTVKNFKPNNLVSLPRASQDRRFTVDPTWTLDHDIPRVDENGNTVGILYPKGYTFNPLDYMRFNSTYVVFDASDRNQLEWFKKSPYATDLRAKILLSGGNFYDTSKALKKPAFYLTDDIVKRMGFKRVPSIAYQKGRYIEIQEVNVLKNKRG